MTGREIRSAVITGPTGAIGTALCRRLLREDIKVYAAVRPGSPRTANLPQHPLLRVIPCDITALNRLPESVPEGGADAFFHLAWTDTTGSGRNDMKAQVQNIGCAVDAAAAAKALGCKVFLFAGSQAEYGRVSGLLTPDTPCFPENGYGMAKLCAGAMTRTDCEAAGIAHIRMRVLSVYGIHDGEGSMISTVIRKLLAGETPQLTAGEQRWDYLYADDAAEAFFLAARDGRDGAVYPLGSGQALPLRRYVEQLRDCIDPALPLGFGAVPYSEKQVMHLQADISALTADTGFLPAYDFAAGIAETVRYYRQKG
ncbi:MAG: NAD-dependent epimerase/dehydratase family protein [Oscillospiraceae bacterium]|nr:NAD-dependent epimerase/dehydratase family protein [Oscillospiraceae bacterium]